MAPPRRRRVLRVVFDERLWAEDLARATAGARTAATTARRHLERDGIDLAELRPCRPDHRDGTRLNGCAKLYVPDAEGEWAILLQGARDDAGPALAVLAFGLRHPPPSSRRPSVYRVAHERLQT